MDGSQDESGETVTLFGVWSSPYVIKVIWALRIKGVAYDYIEEDLTNKSAALLHHNPIYQKVPVLLYHGKPVVESDDIVQFIDEAWSGSGSRILPEDPYERVMARFWARFGRDKLSPPIWKWFTTQGEEQEAAHQASLEQLLVLEKELAGKKFFAGDTIGFVDLSLGVLSYVIPIYEEITGMSIITDEKFPSLSAWMGRFLNWPVVKDHVPPLEKLKHRYQAIRERFLNSQ